MIIVADVNMYYIKVALEWMIDNNLWLITGNSTGIMTWEVQFNHPMDGGKV